LAWHEKYREKNFSQINEVLRDLKGLDKKEHDFNRKPKDIQ
jgi:hypothetical protein